MPIIPQLCSHRLRGQNTAGGGGFLPPSDTVSSALPAGRTPLRFSSDAFSLVSRSSDHHSDRGQYKTPVVPEAVSPRGLGRGKGALICGEAVEVQGSAKPGPAPGEVAGETGPGARWAWARGGQLPTGRRPATPGGTGGYLGPSLSTERRDWERNKNELLRVQTAAPQGKLRGQRPAAWTPCRGSHE